MNSKYLTDNQRKKAIDNLMGIFQEETGEIIGIIKAENLLDSILENIGKEIYNKGIEDAKIKLSLIAAEMDFQLEELKSN